MAAKHELLGFVRYCKDEARFLLVLFGAVLFLFALDFLFQISLYESVAGQGSLW